MWPTAPIPNMPASLPDGEIVARIRQGIGIAGSNIDYLANTVCHLDELGIADGPLHRLLREVRTGTSRPRSERGDNP